MDSAQHDAEYDRPAPKTMPELFNPKAGKRPPSSSSPAKTGGLSAQLAAVSLNEKPIDSAIIGAIQS
jgi:hypothetical protein